jgi:ABC-type branched-subunit amino acid transport system substrate-binding protein
MKITQYIWIGLIGVLLAVFLFTFSVREDAGVVRIGVIAALTGSNASRGESTLQGLELAKDEIEKSGLLDNRTIELIVQDVPAQRCAGSTKAACRD